MIAWKLWWNPPQRTAILNRTLLSLCSCQSERSVFCIWGSNRNRGRPDRQRFRKSWPVFVSVRVPGFVPNRKIPTTYCAPLRDKQDISSLHPSDCCRPDRANAVCARAAAALLKSRHARCAVLLRLRLRCSGIGLRDLDPAYVRNPG